MNASELGFLAGTAAILVAGALAVWRPAPAAARLRRLLPSRATAAFARQRDALVAGLSPVGAFLALVSAAIPPLLLVCWLPGMLFRQGRLWDANVAAFDWFATQESGWLTALHQQVTRVAEWPVVFWASGLAAAALWLAGRGRPLAPALVVASVVAERYLQKVIDNVVGEPHPPTTLATYPSGGAARMLCIYGFIAYLAVRQLPLGGPARRRVVAACWTLVTLGAFWVGFARAYLRLHWPVDIPGGWLFGALLLGVLVAAATSFETAPRRAPAPGRRPEVATPRS